MDELAACGSVARGLYRVIHWMELFCRNLALDHGWPMAEISQVWAMEF